LLITTAIGDSKMLASKLLESFRSLFAICSLSPDVDLSTKLACHNLLLGKVIDYLKRVSILTLVSVLSLIGVNRMV